ncbi:hypothetical protein TNCV_1404831 [Trichonephila clavipes]|nr:hypothetical protein TNCV_1404831 [Trichonephila clavipes]
MPAVDGHGDGPENAMNSPERQTGPTLDIIVRGGIMFDHRTSLVHKDGRLATDLYITQVVEPVVFSLLQGVPTTVFQQDKARSYAAQRTLKSHPSLVDKLSRFESHRTHMESHWT